MELGDWANGQRFSDWIADDELPLDASLWAPEVSGSVGVTFFSRAYFLRAVAERQKDRRLVGCSRNEALARIQEYAQEQGFELISEPRNAADSLTYRKPWRARELIWNSAGPKDVRFSLEELENGTIITTSLPSFSIIRGVRALLVTCVLIFFCLWLASVKTNSPVEHQQPLLMPLVSLGGLTIMVAVLTNAIADSPLRHFIDTFYASSRASLGRSESQLSAISNPPENLELAPLVLGGLLIFICAQSRMPNTFGIPLTSLRGPESAVRVLAMGVTALMVIASLIVARPLLALRITFFVQAFFFNFGLAIFFLNWEVWEYIVGVMPAMSSGQKFWSPCLVALPTAVLFGVSTHLILTAVDMSARLAESMERFQAQDASSAWRTTLIETAPPDLLSVFTIVVWIALSFFNVGWAIRSILTVIYPTAFLDLIRLYSLSGGGPWGAYITIFAHLSRALPMLLLLWLVLTKYLLEARTGRMMRDLSPEESKDIAPILEKLAAHLQMLKPRVRVLREPHIDVYISISQNLVLTERALREFSGGTLEALLAHEMWHLKNHGLKQAVLTLASDWTFFGYGALAALQNSRKMEFEADEFAVKWCLGHDIPAKALSDVLFKMEFERARASALGHHRPLGISLPCMRPGFGSLVGPISASWVKQYLAKLSLFHELYFLGRVASYVYPSRKEREDRIFLMAEPSQ